MNKIKTLEVFNFLSTSLKIRVILFGLFTIFSSFLDIISIGAAFPLLTSLMNAELLISNNYVISIFEFFSIPISIKNVIQYATVSFIFFLLISTFLKIILISHIIKTQNAITVFLSEKIFNATISQEYIYFSKLDTNKLTAVLTQKINSVSLTIQSILTSISNFVSVMFIFTGLIFLNLKITIILSLIFLFFYIGLNLIIKKKIINNSIVASKTSDDVLKVIKETLGSIRYYILRDKTDFIGTIFSKNFNKLKKIQIFLAKSNLIPRHIIETILLSVLSILIVISSIENKSFSLEIPLLGTFLLAAQRMLPNINLLYINFNNILANHSQLNDVLDFLKKQQKKNVNVDLNLIFKKKIKLENINF